MAQEGQAISQASAPRGRAVQFGQTAWAWVGVTPFFIFALMFLIAPTLYLVVGAFQDAQGNFTLVNIEQLFTSDSIRSAYWISIKVSIASAVVGALLGFALAYAAVLGGLPQWLRPTLMSFSGVASNFAGLPLAFAFLATLGRTGIVTTLLITLFDFNIYRAGFNLLSFWGLTLTYLYFQIPLMVLIITPALDGLKREWREAASILGASHWEYWRHVALPILWPAIVGTTLLLFANSFGAIATAYALTGSSLNIVTILL
jgi:putative spermidine/putrescine transport system permease protein